MPNSPESPKGPQAAQKWYLKIDGDSVFGPVDVPALHYWAEQGRIAPGHQLSKDKQTWIPAEQLADLKMEWMVVFDNNTTYGPLNIHALADLVRDKSIPENAKLRNTRTKENSTVSAQKEKIFIAPTAPAPPEKPKKPITQKKEGISSGEIDNIKKQLAA
ncbi:hypothetical protein ACFLS1_11625, partial [Verrucomicrobiota bacterium]